MKVSRPFYVLFALFLILDLFVFVSSCGLMNGVGFSNDNFNLAYPLRVLISTAIKNGIFPFWNHWSFGGSPLISIYSTAAMSPIVWFLSLFGIYTNNTFIMEMILIHILGFVGMVQWLKLHVSKMISLYGAIAFSLSAYMLFQFPINIEGAANPCFYPWYAFGLTLALRGQVKGIAITAFSLYALFTLGYLGTNVIALQIITLFCFVLSWKRDLRGTGFSMIALFAFVLMIGPMLFETFSNQPLGYFTNREVEPFTAAARGRSFVTYFFPNQVSPFVSDSYGGHWAMLYSGIFSMFFMWYAVFNLKKNKLVKTILIFILFSYVAMLSKFNPLARLLVEIIPFYNKIRFHVWNTGIVMFFGVTLSTVGAQMFLEKGDTQKYRLPTIAFFLSILVAYIAKDEFKHWYDFFRNPQLYFIPVSFLILSPLLRMDRDVKVIGLSLLLLLEFYVIKNDYVQFPPVMQNYAEAATVGFPPPQNIRDQNNSMTNGNGHYLSKIPHLYSYQPQIHPLIGALLKKDLKNFALLNLVFYPVDKLGQARAPMGKVEISEMNPSKIEALIDVGPEGETYVWSSPYSPNWQLTVNDAPSTFVQNSSGLTEFGLKGGSAKVSFKYSPWYFPYVMSVAIASALALLILLFRRDRHAPAHVQST